jgi:hypothetical protein
MTSSMLTVLVWGHLLAAASPDAVGIVVDPGTCIEALSLVTRVAARVGDAAVVAGGVAGGRQVSAAFVQGVVGVDVTIGLDVGGVRLGMRRLGPFADCGAAIDAVVLATSLVVDPLGPPPPSTLPSPLPSPPPSTRPTSTATSAGSTVSTTKASTTKASTPLQVGLGGGVGIGSGLGPGVGPVALARLRFDVGAVPLVVGLGGRLDLPPTLEVDGRRRLDSIAGAFSVDGCHRRSLTSSGDLILDACGVVEAGGVRATAVGFTTPDPITAQVMTVGGALQVRSVLLGGLSTFVRLAVTAPVLRARLVARGGEVIWESPLVGAMVVVGTDGQLARGSR